MVSTPRSRLDLLLKLIAIPGVTATDKEDQTAHFIYDWLSSLEWFRNNPSYLTLIPTPLESDSRPLHAVAALVAPIKPTKRTIILTGHFDVVDTAVYGALRDVAFDPEALATLLQSAALDDTAAADLASGNFLFGRGSMDMKCGVAVEMELIRDFSENRNLFDVNLLLIVVPDEENASAGMRGAASWLTNLQNKEGLDYLAAVNTEPTEAGCPTARNPMLFMGTVGKLMPAFLCLGRESHVGAYYDGVSAALLSSHILTLAEGNPDLADPTGGECCPSWICLEHKILREGYSVTVPGSAVVYFNCYATSNSPAKVLEQMRGIATKAARATELQIRKSRSALVELGHSASVLKNYDIPVKSVEEVWQKAAGILGEECLQQELASFMDSLEQPDPREAGIAVMRELARLAEEDGPLVMFGFLPPYYPPRASLVPGAKNNALKRAADDLIREAAEKFAVRITETPFFTGLCDLSYFGFQGRPEELSALEKNLPGWGKVYSLPLQALSELDVPVINFGPSGRDPHKKTERLEKGFSLEQYPILLEYLIRSVADENSRG